MGMCWTNQSLRTVQRCLAAAALALAVAACQSKVRVKTVGGAAGAPPNANQPCDEAKGEFQAADGSCVQQRTVTTTTTLPTPPEDPVVTDELDKTSAQTRGSFRLIVRANELPATTKLDLFGESSRQFLVRDIPFVYGNDFVYRFYPLAAAAAGRLPYGESEVTLRAGDSSGSAVRTFNLRLFDAPVFGVSGTGFATDRQVVARSSGHLFQGWLPITGQDLTLPGTQLATDWQHIVNE